MTKPRVTYIVYHYPQISETYIKTEIEAVRDVRCVRLLHGRERRLVLRRG